MRITSSNGGPPTRSSTWLCWKVLALLCTATTFTAAFTLQMDYKPPVKSSVRKIYDSRFPRDTSPSRSGSTSGSGSGKPRKDELPSRSSSAKSAYAGALSAPLPISGASRMTQSFERRMRDLVLGGKDVVRRSSTVAPTAPNTRKLPSNVLTVESLQDYKKVVADEPEKMVAVRFYAPWCKACKAVAPHFYHMAVKNPNTIFVDVPVTNDNASLHQGLGVPSLPFGHIYHPTAGLVEEVRLTRKFVPEFAKTLEHYIRGSCPLPEDFAEPTATA
jgi:thiol-disulfide isomerase/thioredoxin